MSTDTPTAIIDQDRKRGSPRFVPLTTVSARLLRLDSPEGGSTFGVLSNISKSGACVIANRPIPEGERVQLELSSKLLSGLLNAPGHVVWSAAGLEPIKELVGYLIGLRFDEEYPDLKTALANGNFQEIP